ncbi:carboxylating nicotinate-nucleotide diphosphorylase [Ferrimicrobium sp.]|uniref:carboxylating nicotinate-nucleotide diphosphorylase n=1 Tax=Ferrimicrobium sp. TaxID=2926050 RepID=UPI00261046EB|nr:carboxylating nicotinate-nucleotide diphosphorylase [Ferrimicrobium sp.]
MVMLSPGPIVDLALIDLALDEDLVEPVTAAEETHPLPGADGVAPTRQLRPCSTAGDLTGSLVAHQVVALTLRARAHGVFVGQTVAPVVLGRVAERLGTAAPTYDPIVTDGTMVEPGATLAWLRGDLRTVLAAERTMLNLLCHLSGVASTTRSYVEAVVGTKAVIRDTRKTTPGLRSLEKYAVRCGGGSNHRLGLWDGILIKDNHLAFAPMEELVTRARLSHPDRPLEVEVDNLTQLHQALDLAVDLILLDNMELGMIAEAVQISRGRCRLEVSGGVGLDRLRAIAETGVDYIAVGALTHSTPILDLGLDYPDA